MLKRKPIKRKKKEIDKEEIAKMQSFFLDIWKKRSHYCTICGKWLGHEPKSYMFDHLLEKSKYPEFKYEEENIALVCFQCHEVKSLGHPKEKYIEKIEYVRNKFINLS